MSYSDDETPMNAIEYWGGHDGSGARRPRVFASRGGRGGANVMRISRGQAARVDAGGSAQAATSSKTLEQLDEKEAAQLVEEDASAADDLSASLKLVKAMQILSNAFFVGAKTEDGAAKLGVETFAKVTSLLSGAMKDFADFTLPVPSGAGDNSAMGIMQQLLEYEARQAEGGGTAFQHPAFASVDEKDLLGLFRQNALLTLAALQPARYLDASNAADKPATDSPSSPTAPTPAYLENLPNEILLSIFTFARDAAAVRTTPRAPAADPYLLALMVPPPVESKNVSEGSKSAALRFALNLALVCRKWVKPARAVALETVYIRHGRALVSLNKTLATPEAASLAEQIRAMDISIVPAGAENPSTTSSSSSRGSPYTSQFQYDIPEAERNAEAGFATLVKSAPNLSKLKLVIRTAGRNAGGPGFYMHPSRASARSFLDGPVYDTLTTLPAIRSLTLSFVIDFGDFETIIQNLPSLEDLHLSAIDNLSGATTVTSSSPHPASSMRKFRLGDPSISHLGQITNITPQQLSWLIEPSIASGKLEVLDIVLYADGLGRHGNGQPIPPAFASAEFADLLVRAGANLKTPNLQDVSASGLADPSFAQAPHNGSFDYALSHLTSLRILVISGVYTGTNFLPSITPHLNLKKLALSTLPVGSSASACADALEANWDRLKLFKVTSLGPRHPPFGGGAGPGGPPATAWTGAERRRIKEIGARKGFTVEL